MLTYGKVKKHMTLAINQKFVESTAIYTRDFFRIFEIQKQCM